MYEGLAKEFNELMRDWETPTATTDKLLRGLIAAGYIDKRPLWQEMTYCRTEKTIEKGTSKEVLWFIRRYRGPTTTDIKRFMLLESREWESIRTNLLEEGMITKEQGKWWLT